MTLKVNVSIPVENGPYEALVRVGGQSGQATILAPGDSADFLVHSTQGISITELPAGSKKEGLQHG